MEKRTDKFVIMIGLAAFFILMLSAYYSVIGIGLLFSGKRLFTSIMAGSFEFAKVSLTSYLTRYWKKIFGIFRIYFVIAVISLVGISSAGIYCYLTDAYHKTAHEFETVSAKVNVNDSKITILEEQKEMLINDNVSITNEISGIRNDIQRNDKQLEVLYNATITDTTQSWYNNIWSLRSANNQNREYIERLNDTKLHNISKMDSINSKIIELSEQTTEMETSEALTDVGPLGRLSKIFNVDMDTIVKWFVLLIICIFDPLGVLLVVSFNKVLMDKSIIQPVQKNIVRKTTNTESHSRTVSGMPNSVSNVKKDVIVKENSGGPNTMLAPDKNLYNEPKEKKQNIKTKKVNTEPTWGN